MGAAQQRVINLLDHFSFRIHICFVFELMGPDMYTDLKDGSLRGYDTHEKL